MEFTHSCYGINEKGHLTIGSVDTVELAAEYGTPAYVMDEDYIRAQCRMYRDSAKKYFGEGSLPYFASKALCIKRIYQIIAQEGIGTDVVSPGELYTAKAADFPMEKICFHGNNKTDRDIEMAVSMGVGRFVVDNDEELDSLDAIAGRYGIKQKILLRITPGIDPHTHKAVITGNVDSKFGNAIVTGQAMAIVKRALAKKNIELTGIHCHIGSQIFEIAPFEDAARIMVGFMADVRRECGYEMYELNLGGGFGVRYIPEDPIIDYEKNIAKVADAVKKNCAEQGISVPRVILEPGRSIVAGAGITLYTVGSVKEITGFKNYVSIDGGMPDNPRYALYSSQYEAFIANRAAEEKNYECTIAGRCCESGDLIAENIKIQSAKRGDIMAVTVTGAYNYAMASNYNRITRPPIILIKDKKPYVALERESFEDLIRNDR